MINYTKKAHARELIEKELSKSGDLSYARGGPDHKFITFLQNKYNL